MTESDSLVPLEILAESENFDPALRAFVNQLARTKRISPRIAPLLELFSTDPKLVELFGQDISHILLQLSMFCAAGIVKYGPNSESWNAFEYGMCVKSMDILLKLRAELMKGDGEMIEGNAININVIEAPK